MREVKKTMILKINNNEPYSFFTVIIAIGLVILMILLFTGCQSFTDMINSQEQLQDQTDTGGGVAMELHDTMPYGEMPPIDLNLPANLETATFGMG